MSKQLLGALLLTSFSVLGAPRPAIDAFLSRHDTRAVVDPRGLSSVARASYQLGLVSSIEPRLGVPTFFWSSPGSARGFRDLGLTPEQAARRYLLTHAELYRGEPSRWAEAQVSQVHDLHDGTAVIVDFQQRIKGVRVFRDELKVIMNAKLQLVALAGYLTPETKVRGEFSLSAASAVGAAFQSLAGRSLDPAALQDLGQFGGGYEHFSLAGSTTPVRARPVYFPLPEGVVPGFYVELQAPVSDQATDYLSFVISAVDGAVLYRKDLKADAFGYRVWADPVTFLPDDGPQGLGATPYPTATPSNFDPGSQPQTLVTLDHAGLSTGDPWLAPGATQTLGNNVIAYADLRAGNGYGTGDLMGATSAPGAFDYLYDFDVSPEANATQRQAAVTQLFFNNNFFHDWYYDDGFDERAGNGQKNNLMRGGAGNDPVLSEAQDYSGRSNANMSTPSDGQSPQMQMYVFDGANAATLSASAGTPQSFNTLGAEFGLQAHNLTGTLMLANDGDATPTDGCATTWPAGSAAGKIVLIDRGLCTFAQKAWGAQAAGAAGVIIANNMAGGPMSMPDANPPLGVITIPAMSVSLNSGNALKAMLTSGATTATLVRSAPKNRDGTLDNGVVAHEWGHYISNRLIGDGNGISNLQAVGMGEGWADFHAALLVARESDAQLPSNTNWTGAFGLAGWAGYTADTNGYYYGFRRYPLSVDFAKNPLTFKHIADGVRLPTTAPVAFGASGASNSEVHNTGEVWAAMLWECYVALLRDSRYTFPQAQARMKKYLVAAYKATALMPTFVDARDAVLAVAAANDPDDFAAFWAAFARRGMGVGAVAPDRDSQDNTPVVESFTIGNALTITEVTLDDSRMSCDHDGTLDANEEGVLTVRVRNSGSGTVSAANVAIVTTSAGVTFPSGASLPLPSTAPFGTSTLSFPVRLADVAGPQGAMFNISVTDASLTRGPVTLVSMFRLNFDVVPASSRLDDVEAPMSQWTSASDPRGNTGSNFRMFQSTATQHFWFGPNPSSPADTWLTSPPLTVSAAPLVITFKHRFDFEQSPTEFFDGAVIEVSADDGLNWTDVGAQSTPGYTGTLTSSQNQSTNPIAGLPAFVGKSANYPTFNLETVNLGTTYAGQTILFRFRIGADDAAAAKGWEVDDISFTGITNKPFTSVTSDPNTCTNGAPTVTIGPNVEVDERSQVTLVGSATDPDGDPLTLTWTQVAGPQVTITGGTFTAPEVTVDTLISLELTVSDGRAVSQPREQTVLVKNVNRAPTATVPATQEALMGESVTVLGSGGDADGDAITYEWSQVGGPEVALTGATTDTVTFQAPAVLVSDVVKLQLVVRDPTQASAPAVVDVVIKNPTPTTDLAPMTRGCGCASGLELLPFAALGLLLRARRRRS